MNLSDVSGMRFKGMVVSKSKPQGDAEEITNLGSRIHTKLVGISK